MNPPAAVPAGARDESSPNVWPISYRDVLDARDRLRPYLPVTPLRNKAALDARAVSGVTERTV